MRPRLIGRDDEIAAGLDALACDGVEGVLLVGPAGSGRTSLAAEIADAAARLDIDVIVLDDVHRSTKTAVASIEAADASPGRRVVATLAAHATAPPEVNERTKTGRWLRVTLGPLSSAAIEDLVAGIVGAPVEPRSLHELSHLCRGLPAIAHLLCHDAIDQEAIQTVDGLARFHIEHFRPARLGDHAASRLDGCTTELRDLLELLAVSGPLPLTVIDDLGCRPAAMQGEADRLLEAHQDHRRVMIDFAVPAIALAISGPVPLLRRIDHLDQVVAAWDRVGLEGDEDRRRMACWRLDLGQPLDPTEALATAATALEAHQYEVAERLARAAEPHGASVLAEALEKQGRHVEALEILGRGDELPDPVVLAANQYWSEGTLDLAEAGLSADPDSSSSGSIAEATMRAWLLMADGRQPEASAVAGRVRATAESDDPEHIWATVVMGLDLALRGDADRATEMVEPFVSFDSDATSFERSGAGLGLTFSLMAGGRVGEAADLTAKGLQWALDGDVDLIVAAWYGLSGMTHRASGDLATACNHLQQAVAASSGDPYHFSRLFAAEAAAAWAQRGDALRARSWWDQAGEHDPTGLNRIFDGWVSRLGAWVIAAEGDLAGAVDQAVDAADQAAELGQDLTEMVALHTVARLGRPTVIDQRAAAIAARSPHRHLQALSNSIDAASRRDAAALIDLAADFGRLGAWALATEAATTAAHAHHFHGEHQHLSSALELRAQYLDRCQDLATPATVAPGRSRLTTRERDVAVLASTGLPSAEIAARLDISRRTVDNHLGRVYDKLGITRRGDLGRALGLVADDPA